MSLLGIIIEIVGEDLQISQVKQGYIYTEISAMEKLVNYGQHLGRMGEDIVKFLHFQYENMVMKRLLDWLVRNEIKKLKSFVTKGLITQKGME